MTFAEAIRELDLRHPGTREPVSSLELIDILKEDVVQAAQRPGSWEGSNMLDVLRRHGFFNDY